MFGVLGVMSSMLKRFFCFSKINLLLLAVSVLGFLGLFSPKAQAASLYDPLYEAPLWTCNGTLPSCCDIAQVPQLIIEMFTGTGLYTGQQDLQLYYYSQTLAPEIIHATMQMADDVRNAVLFQVGAIGAMLDGQTFNQALLVLQKQTTDTLKTQTVSDQICRFGTLSRSLSGSEDKANNVRLGLTDEMLQREMMQNNMNSGSAKGVGRETGRNADKDGRIHQWKTVYCDPADSAGALADTSWCAATSDARRNKDINLFQTLYGPQTLDIDFTGSQTSVSTADEQDLFALSSNLFSHDLMTNIGPSDFAGLSTADDAVVSNKMARLMDFRA